MTLEGVFHVLATPFRSDQTLDRAGLRSLVQEVIATGVDGLTILGVMGEAHKLSADERSKVIETVFEGVGGRLPIVIGASRDGTRPAVEAVEEAAALGAAAVMVAPPTFLGANPQLTAHFQAVGEVGVPIVLQDYPPINGVKLAPSAISNLIDDVPAITCVKLEDPPTPRRSRQVLERVEREITVLGGLSGLYLLEELRHGTHGTMTGFPLPAQLVELWRSWKNGDEGAARATYRRILPLLVLDSQPVLGVSSRKTLWREQGVLDSAAIRSPGAELDQLEIDGLRETLGALAPAL